MRSISSLASKRRKIRFDPLCKDEEKPADLVSRPMLPLDIEAPKAASHDALDMSLLHAQTPLEATSKTQPRTALGCGGTAPCQPGMGDCAWPLADGVRRHPDSGGRYVLQYEVWLPRSQLHLHEVATSLQFWSKVSYNMHTLRLPLILLDKNTGTTPDSCFGRAVWTRMCDPSIVVA